MQVYKILDSVYYIYDYDSQIDDVAGQVAAVAVVRS